MRHILILFSFVALAGCGAVDSARRLVESSADLRVQEVARSQQCGSFSEDSRVTLFRDLEALKAWEVGRLSLSEGRDLADAPHALIEMGQRKTGGYGLAVSRAARVNSDGRLTLTASYVDPPSTAFLTQALTAPCVLVRLPKNDYRSAEVRDPSGRQRADSTDAAPVTSPVTEPPAESEPAAVEEGSTWWPF